MTTFNLINLLSLELRLNPYPMYALMRQHMPAFMEPNSGVWSVFRYDDVKTVLTEHGTFSSGYGEVHARQNGSRMHDSMIGADPPAHTRLRALVSRAFTPRAVANLAPRIKQLTDQLLDQVIETGQLDLVHDLSAPLPVMVIAEMLGIPPADYRQFKDWSDQIVASSNLMVQNDAVAASSRTAMHEMYDYFARIIAQRRVEPRDDLISGLIAAELDGERLSEQDIFSFCWLLLVAGNETTTNLLSNAIITLLEHPDALAQLRSDLSLLPSAIEEVLRYRSPVQAMFRFTKREVEVAGQTIPAGKMVLAWIGSANHDESKVSNADAFDLRRDPNPHIAFGHGVHFCLGAPLARLESRIALTEMLTRLKNLERADDVPLEPVEGFIVHGVKRLPLRFELQRNVA